MEELIINLDILESFKRNFTTERNRFFARAFHAVFRRSLMNTSSNSTVLQMGSNLISKYEFIDDGYQAILTWWDSYINAVISLESLLSGYANSIIHTAIFTDSIFSDNILDGSNVIGIDGDWSMFLRDGETLYADRLVPWFHLYQQQGVWASQTYGPPGATSFSAAGCYPVTYAMIIRSLTGQAVCPTEIGDVIVGHENSMYRTRNSDGRWQGTGHGATPLIMDHYGLEATRIGPSEFSSRDEQHDVIRETLANGGAIFLSVAGAPFPSGGHAIAFRAMTSTGQVIVSCSDNNRQNNETVWEIEDILGLMRSENIWAVTVPK